MLMCKRAIFTDIQKLPELSCPGVYLLYGPDVKDERNLLYIGEGDLLQRLQDHYRSKDFWTDFICFTAADKFLTKVHIQYLESRLIERARAAQRCRLVNLNNPELPNIAEALSAAIEDFLGKMLDCLTVLGIDFFKLVETKPTEHDLFTLTSKGATAQGYEAENGFVVKAGSTASKDVTEAFRALSYNTTRKHLIENGVLVDGGNASTLRFSIDHEFTSPSTAASIVCGNSMNGRTAWKTVGDITLKAIQEANILTPLPSQN